MPRQILHTLVFGRFQPFHIGHLALIEAALDKSRGSVTIGVIANTRSAARGVMSRVGIMARLGDLRQRKGLNPYSVIDRIEMIEKVIESRGFRNKVRVVPAPRPELYWELIKAMFPGKRQWVLPRSDDPFEKAKQEFFRGKGDKVTLVRSQGDVSGTSLRRLLASEPRQAAELVPTEIRRQVLGGRKRGGKR